MLAAAQKFLIQLNRKTTQFYRTAVVRQMRRTCLPLAFRLDLGDSSRRTVFARRRQYLEKPIMKRGGRDDLNFPARISLFCHVISQHCLLRNIVRLSSRPDRRRRKSLGGPSMITLNEALGDAQRKRIAIGHFNVSDLVALKAVTGAARALQVPALIRT